METLYAANYGLCQSICALHLQSCVSNPSPLHELQSFTLCASVILTAWYAP